MIEINTTKQFEKSFKKLMRAQQEDTNNALDQFCINPSYSGLNFERVRGHPKMYTIRANLKLRIALYPTFNNLGAVSKAEVVNIGTHDEIYRNR